MGKKGLGKLLAGAAVGLGIGMLLAPKSGEETRKDLKKGAKNLANKVKDIDLNEVKDDLVDSFEKLKAELADMDAAKAKKIAKKKINELSDKAQDLVDMAKEKSAPVVEKTAKDIKKKLATMLADMQEKLED